MRLAVYLRFFLLMGSPMLARTDGTSMAGTQCVRQVNASILVFVTSQPGILWPPVIDASNTQSGNEREIGLQANNSIIKVYRELRSWRSSVVPSQTQLQAAASCLTAGYVASLLGGPRPALVQWEAPCHSLKAPLVGQALADICRHQGFSRLFLLYTADYFSYAMSLAERMSPEATLIQWSLDLNRRQGQDFLENVIKAVDSHLQAFVVIAGEQTSAVFRQARHRSLLNGWAWILATEASIDTWEGLLSPGDRVILLDTSELEAWNCSVTSVQWDRPTSRTRPLPQEYRDLSVWILSLASENLELLGIWNEPFGLDMFRTDIWGFQTFQEKHFNVTSLNWPVFHFQEERNGEIVWSGVCVEILDALAAALNFSYTMTPSVDGMWGSPVGSNGTWNGMVGMVLRKEVDFALGKFTITDIRDSVADFAVPFWHEPAVIVMRKPEENSLLVYLGPFHPEVWLALLAAIPLAALALVGLMLLEVLVHDGRQRCKEFPVTKYLKLSIWFTYGAAVQQGTTWRPRSLALRFLIGFWWFFTLVLSATYTGNLIAVLAVPKTILPIENLEDLTQQSEFSYGVLDGAALLTVLQYSSYKVYQDMYNKSLQFKENLVSSHTEGLKRVKTESYIYMGEVGGVAPVVYTDCSYVLGKEEFLPASFAFIFPENSPYLPYFNEVITTLVENGMIDKWKKLYYPRDVCSMQQGGGLPDPATLRDTQGAFVLLSLGMLGGILVLVVEAACWSCWRRERHPPILSIGLSHIGLTHIGLAPKAGSESQTRLSEVVHGQFGPNEADVIRHKQIGRNGVVPSNDTAVRFR